MENTEKETTEKTGLALLSDELLAQIVENDIDGYGTIQTPEGRAAFKELARRSKETA